MVVAEPCDLVTLVIVRYWNARITVSTVQGIGQMNKEPA
jgi:hypothetical protein